MNLNDSANWVNQHSDYVYVGQNMNNRAGAETIVLHEKPDAHGGQGMNLLYGDGHVEFMMRQDALRLIEKQQNTRKGGAP